MKTLAALMDEYGGNGVIRIDAGKGDTVPTTPWRYKLIF